MTAPNEEFFQQFPNRTFVETGSYLGEGIVQALRAGFQEIHSIELSRKYYEHCNHKFADRSNVHFWLGDSVSVLPDVIAKIEGPITFWLDGHWFPGKEVGRGFNNTPLLRELDAIEKHPCKDHTILIDDVSCFDTMMFDYIPLDFAIRRILEINPRYEISYHEGCCPKDILVARLPT